jgi:ATP/maltotriose-dependent transcriptional regulator MalT
MSDLGMIQEEYENNLVGVRRPAIKFPGLTKHWDNAQLKHDRQLAELTEDHIQSKNSQVERLLFWMARERAKSHRWNVNALVLSYLILITVVVLTLNEVSSLIVGLVAVFGMAILWFFSWLQSKKIERQFYQQEMREYLELLSREATNNCNTAEPSTSIDSVESPLTQRQLEVLGYVAKGQMNKVIGVTLGINEETVKNHLFHIFAKLGVNDRTSAVVMALRNGWIKYDHIK